MIIIIKFNILYHVFYLSNCQLPVGRKIYNLRELLSFNI